MAIPPETKELAYKVWCDHGQNLSETERVLNGELGYVISRQSLHAWKTEYDWEGRAARAEAEGMRIESETAGGALLISSLKQKRKYEEYFETLPVGKVDVGATNAYNGILKTILNIREKTDAAINTGKAVEAVDPVSITTPEEAVSALETAVERKLNLMLSQPDTVSMRSVQEMEKALALIAKLKARYVADSGETQGEGGLSNETVNEINRRMLGIE